MDPAEPPMSELDMIKARINAKTDESLDSTRRMVKMCEESQDAGIRTMGMLDAQGEQLDNVEGGMDRINQDIKAAEKNLDQMNKCCGLCICPWNRIKRFDNSGAKYASSWKNTDADRVRIEQPSKATDKVDGMNPAKPEGGYITRITGDAREEDMENNMEQVHGMVGNLRSMAVDMGSEIEQQNRQIDRIGGKTDYNKDRIQHANKQATKLLK